ncbi:MAG: hypothetical protein AAF467_09285 [Actinomycetota bacterium]
MSTNTDVRAAFVEARRLFRRHPDVTAIALGPRRRQGEFHPELTVIAGIDRKQRKADVGRDDLLPLSVAGLPVDVQEMGRPQSLGEPLWGWVPYGAKARNRVTQRVDRVLHSGSNIFPRLKKAGAGTLGFFMHDHAQVIQDLPDLRHFAVTNAHVVARADRTRTVVELPVDGVTAVGHGRYSDLTGLFRRDVGVVARQWGYQAAANGTISMPLDLDDFALVQLNAGEEYAPDVGDLTSITDVRPVADFDDGIVDPKYLYKYGTCTGWTKGELTGMWYERLDPPPADEDDPNFREIDGGVYNIGYHLLIRPEVDPDNLNRTNAFAYEGDSGSAVVDDRGNLVGQIHRVVVTDQQTRYTGVATPIQRIIDTVTADPDFADLVVTTPSSIGFSTDPLTEPIVVPDWPNQP